MRARLKERWAPWVKGLLCAALAEATVLLLWRHWPLPSYRTETLGYPPFAGYPIDLHYRFFFLQGLLFPLLTWGLFRLRGGWGASAPARRPVLQPPTGLWGRVIFTAAVYQLGWVAGHEGADGLRWVLGTALQVGSLALGAWAWDRCRNLPAGTTLGRAQGWAAVFSPVALYWASEQTRMGTELHPWFGGWALVAWVGLGALGWRGGRGPWKERALFYGAVVPAALWLTTAELPGPRMWLHPHHDGEVVMNSELLRLGKFPWRDFLFQHGLLQDPLAGRLGHLLFENTLWGADAGHALIWKPLYRLAQYALLLSVLGLRLAPLVLALFLLPHAQPLFFDGFNLRFLPLWLCFAGAVVWLRRPGAWGAFALGALAAVTLLLTPEAAPGIVGLGVALGVGAYGRTGGRTQLSLGLGAVAVVSAFAAWLWRHGALGAFLSCYREVAQDHRYSVGLPLRWELGWWFPWAAALPLVVGGLFLVHYSRLGDRRREPVPAVLLGWVVFNGLYYLKFLARADEHVLAHGALIAPVVLWLALEAAGVVERALGERTVGGRALVPAVLAVAVIYWAPPLGRYFDRFSVGFAKPAAQRSRVERLGYGSLPVPYRVPYEDLKALFATHLRPGDGVFDFTNAVGFTHYLLGLPMALPYQVPYTHPGAQDRIADALDRHQVPWVILFGEGNYAALDGVPSQVRYHRLIARVLERYVPFAVWDHHVVMLRRGLDRGRPQVRGLKGLDAFYGFERCDWGRSLAYLPERRGGVPQPVERERKLADEWVTYVRVSPETTGRVPWLELEVEVPRETRVLLGDGNLTARVPTAAVAFSVVPGRTTYRVPLGSCAGWRGFEGGRLELRHTGPLNLKELRLGSDVHLAVGEGGGLQLKGDVENPVALMKQSDEVPQ